MAGLVPAIHALLAEIKTWMHRNSGLPEFRQCKQQRKSAIADLLCTRPGMTNTLIYGPLRLFGKRLAPVAAGTRPAGGARGGLRGFVSAMVPALRRPLIGRQYRAKRA
jgi:hypothetical protein